MSFDCDCVDVSALAAFYGIQNVELVRVQMARYPEVHLQEDREDITVNREEGWAFPIGADNRPGRDLSSKDNRVQGLLNIVNYLDVEKSVRYRVQEMPTGSRKTFCNVYTHDYSYLAGVYLPRVWWGPKSIRAFDEGSAVEPKYNKSLFELSANSLFFWFWDHGFEYGWELITSLDDLQDRANNGYVAVISSLATQAIGHIAVCVPEHDGHMAHRDSSSSVIKPVLSQSGARNIKFDTDVDYLWWQSSKFETNFWAHD